MAQVANIVVNDGKATPQAHTFVPFNVTPQKVMWEDRAGGIFIGYNKMTLTQIRPTGAMSVSGGPQRSIKSSFKLETPILETIPNNTANDGGYRAPPSVAYRPTVEMGFTAPDRSSDAEREDLWTLFVNTVNIAKATNPLYLAFVKNEMSF